MAEHGRHGGPGTVGDDEARAEPRRLPEPAPEGAVQPAPPDGEMAVVARSHARMVARRFLAHRLAVASLVVLVVVVLLALVGGRLWRFDFAERTGTFSSPPSLEHPMGTNGLGQDTFAQVLRGAQRSVQIALTVAVLSTFLGVVVGALAGFYRGFVDGLLMRLTDLALVVPSIAIFALVARRIPSGGGSWVLLALLLAAFSWMPMARVVRGVFLSLREKEFVEAARALGASDARIIRKHLLPNATGPIIVHATITVAIAILAETSLSYLGLGIQPPDTSLGLLVSLGQSAATTRPWLFYFPGLFIIVIALCVNFLGDGLRDAFDPTQRRVRA